MLQRHLCQLGMTAAALLFLCSCGLGGPRIDPVTRVTNETLDMVTTDTTRLTREYVQAAIQDRASDERVNAAFEKALAEPSEEAKTELIRAIELKFIHDPNTSTLDLLGPEVGAMYRNFDWQPADYPGGPEGPNEAKADEMCDLLTVIRPERRANSKNVAVVVKSQATDEIFQYMESEWVPVPGQEKYMLNRYAAESFVQMREAAKQDGVDLVIVSAHRSRARAEANAARTNNPAAVASFSSHTLGLAIDFQLSQGDFQIEEVTTRPMSTVIRMRESPVHKWIFLRADEFGWYPYQHEPWHWEYNPPGFREVFWKNFPAGPPPMP